MAPKKRKLGTGAYGTVYRGTDALGTAVAIKTCLFDDAVTLPSSHNGTHTVSPNLLKEISVLTELSHPNLIRMLDVFVDKSSVRMVFELMELDLGAYLRLRRRLSASTVTSLARQLFAGLEYMHLQGVMHRDLKPQNLLLSAVDSNDPCLKIADLGLARFVQEPVQMYSSEMITLWYRPPELLLGADSYGPEVDIWSAGVIVFEMSLGRPLFAGSSDVRQLGLIVQILGMPDTREWPEMWDYPTCDELWLEISPGNPSSLEEVAASQLSSALLALIRHCLHYRPLDRCSAVEALQNEMFAQ